MTIKMIATDMDGTFLRDNDHYDVARFERVLAQLTEKKIEFVAASGRQVANLREIFAPVAKKGGKINYVGANGSVVATGDQNLFSVHLTPQQVQDVIFWNANNPSSSDNLVILSGDHGTYVSNHASDSVRKMVAEFYPEVHQVEKFVEVDDPILGVTFVWPHDEVQEHVQEIQDTFGDQLHATGSGFGSVDILPKGVDKGTGLQVLQDLYDVKNDEVMVFGDNANDFEMLKKYPNAYLMPNALPSLKDEGLTEALASNTEDGVLKTIETKLNLN
ncbi:Cof-type HAD-IIB family hydrolase [Leuconostocaceae bacterium ESL0723]|nr:Cof-type HAD-IIB family hydrolase [Leuconostocaceae bacterium ESL0723]